MQRVYPAVYLKMKWPKALKTPTAIRKENPDAHNMTPLERASGYGNTAGTILPCGVALTRVAPYGTHSLYQRLCWFPSELWGIL
jgi:hypothetical protein